MDTFHAGEKRQFKEVSSFWAGMWYSIKNGCYVSWVVSIINSGGAYSFKSWMGYGRSTEYAHELWKWKSLSGVWLFATPWTTQILRARILEWVAFPFSRGSSQHKDWTQVSRIGGRFFTSWATREAHESWFASKWTGFWRSKKQWKNFSK